MFWWLQPVKQPAQVKQAFGRSNKIASIAAGIILSGIVVLSAPTTIFAAGACRNSACVIACNHSNHTCGLFPRNSYPDGYAPAPYIPLGYKRVRLSKCDRMVCPTGRSCTSPVPVGNKTEGS